MTLPVSPIILSMMVTLLAIAGEVFCCNITGQPSVTGTRGEDISIPFNVSGFKNTVFGVYVNNTGNKLLIVNTQGIKKNVPFGEYGNHNTLRTRPSAHYYYTGESGGQKTGQVVLTITDLKLEDSGRFLLVDGVGLNISSVTVLSVNYGPEKCGADLKPEYMVNQGDQLTLSMAFCGKPQPIVTCKFHNRTYTSVNVTEGNEYNYTYTFVIPTNLKPCEEEKLICTATGHGDPVIRETNVVRKSPKEKKVSDAVCAGHIVRFVVGVILICAVIYVYPVKALNETWKRVGFIIAVVVGLPLVIWSSVSYPGLRMSNDNDNCDKGSLSGCDIAFIAFGVISGIVAFGIIVGVWKSMKEVKTMNNGGENIEMMKSE